MSQPIVLYQEPTPPVSDLPMPLIPDLAVIIGNITKSIYKLFFILNQLASTNVREWSLVCVIFDHTLSHHPHHAIHIGKFLVEFYICNPSDIKCSGINHRYWLEYHSTREYPYIHHQETCHLIHPSERNLWQTLICNYLADGPTFIMLTRSFLAPLIS